MDEETKHKHRERDEGEGTAATFDQVVEEAAGESFGEEAPQDAMQYVVVGLAVLILLMNVYSIARINELGAGLTPLKRRLFLLLWRRGRVLRLCWLSPLLLTLPGRLCL